MPRPRPKSLRRTSWSLSAVDWALVVGLLGGIVLIVLTGGQWPWAWAYVSGLAMLKAGLTIGRQRETNRWADPLRVLSRTLSAFNDQPDEPWDFPIVPATAELVAPLRELQGRYLALRSGVEPPRRPSSDASESGDFPPVYLPDPRMTRSGSFEVPSPDPSSMVSGEFSVLEMISRLDPKTLRWLESTPAEQAFLGWSLAELKVKSFLEIVQADDRKLAKQELRTALECGEGHGLIYRITTARGESKAVEMNVGVRYGADRRVLHLRCHLADVTAKLRDEDELRRRTHELTHANDDLRRANRELQELKDRYGDLYENAPAMYFTVDHHGQFLECNNTLIRSLGFSRREIIGQPVLRLLPKSRGPTPADRFADDLRAGPVEFESEWSKRDGEVIAVWVTGNALPGLDGKVRHVRCVAQDITARRLLEGQLRVKNDRLASANAELSRRNKELDEFTYVVSHDLQEPLRTLIAFSDFLMRDHGEKLDDSGREYVRYLVEASRRLRSLIQDLLSLSRAGKVTGEFGSVNLDEVVDILKADFAELLRSKNAEIRVDKPLSTAFGDRDRIGQLLANLVSNGLKYNRRPDPVVEVSADRDEAHHRVTISIKDNGIGIEPRYHSRIFQLFRRLHTPEEYDGTGAGLAIALKIVEAHCGRIWVESEPGQGSTFRVRLPTSPEGISTEPDEVLHAR